MVKWTQFDDYIYVDGATSQTLSSVSACKKDADNLYFLGYERHIESGSYVDDNYSTVYLYNVNTNILEKYNDTVRATLENYLSTYSDDYINSVSVNDYGRHWVVTNGVFPVVILNVDLSINSGTPDATIQSTTFIYRLTRTTCTLLYDPLSSKDYMVWEFVSDSTHAWFFPQADRVHKEAGWNIANMIYTGFNSDALNGKKLYIPGGVFGNFYIKQSPQNFNNSFFLHINEFGISYETFDIQEASAVYNSSTTNWDITERYIRNIFYEGEYSVLQGLYSKELLKYEDSTIVEKEKELIAYPNLILDTTDVSSTYTRMLYNIGYFNNGKFVFPNLNWYSDGYYIRNLDMYSNDAYNGNNPTSYMTKIDAINTGGYTSIHKISFNVEGAGILLSLQRTAYNNGSYGYLTFIGMSDILVEEIEKNIFSFSTELPRGFLMSNNRIYFQSKSSTSDVTGYVNYVMWAPHRWAKPTSITSSENSIFIGGSTDTPVITSGIYFKDGAPSEDTSISGFIEDPIFVEFKFPEIVDSVVTVSGDDWFEIVSNSGYSYVKYFIDDVLLHGKLGAYKCLEISSGYFEDISSGLPSGIIPSINFDAAFNAYANVNSYENLLYKWTGEGNWTKVSGYSEEIATTALITYLDDRLYVGHSGTIPEIDSTYLSLISVEDANGGLPSNVIITDIEEDLWNDR